MIWSVAATAHQTDTRLKVSPQALFVPRGAVRWNPEKEEIRLVVVSSRNVGFTGWMDGNGTGWTRWTIAPCPEESEQEC